VNSTSLGRDAHRYPEAQSRTGREMSTLPGSAEQENFLWGGKEKRKGSGTGRRRKNRKRKKRSFQLGDESCRDLPTMRGSAP